MKANCTCKSLNRVHFVSKNHDNIQREQRKCNLINATQNANSGILYCDYYYCDAANTADFNSAKQALGESLRRAYFPRTRSTEFKAAFQPPMAYRSMWKRFAEKSHRSNGGTIRTLPEIP